MGEARRPEVALERLHDSPPAASVEVRGIVGHGLEAGGEPAAQPGQRRSSHTRDASGRRPDAAGAATGTPVRPRPAVGYGCFALSEGNSPRRNACGRGSVGRASPCQGEGRGFESRRPLGEVAERRASPRVEWPRGEATACKAVYKGSNPVSTSQFAGIYLRRQCARAISSVGERFLDTEEVTGSIPVSPTTRQQVREPSLTCCLLRCRNASTRRRRSRSGPEFVHFGTLDANRRPPYRPSATR